MDFSLSLSSTSHRCGSWINDFTSCASLSACPCKNAERQTRVRWSVSQDAYLREKKSAFSSSPRGALRISYIGKSANTLRVQLTEHRIQMESQLSRRSQPMRAHTNDCSKQTAVSVTMIYRSQGRKNRLCLDDRYYKFFATILKNEHVVEKS